jgi:aminoglycoside 6'-N-acetyltransferase I
MSDINIRRISDSDNIVVLAQSIIPEQWGKDNELEPYDEESLKQIVNNSNYVLLIAYDGEKPVGITIAAKQLKPDGKHWLYVDELGVRPHYRQRGIARSMVEKLFEIAKEWNLEELWLGTEPDNDPANGLYRSLKPSETETFIGYTYTLK